NETLVMADRGGVEIDYCPKCRGVWLDRGELDKIIERSAAAPQPAPQQPQYQQPPQGHHPGYQHGYGQKPHYKKRESFLSELFDF
ncbi:MAG: zf-TFIIB domain-containing protein, partial [Rhodospirillaceae bacterium]|nr:zf-TFIIB domain-containing protein [Rhodospirillaceae bacterium]